MSKIYLFQAIQFSQTILIQIIQFSIRIAFVHTLLNDKTVLFQTISLVLARSLNIKTVLFQVIQFNICTHSIYIIPIDKTLSGVTTPGQSGPRSNDNEELLRILQSLALLEPHHQIV